MRNLSSSAAASLNVKATMRSFGIAFTATRHATRRAMTSVLPEPAPATNYELALGGRTGLALLAG